jgi:hypothetical protein
MTECAIMSARQLPVEQKFGSAPRDVVLPQGHRPIRSAAGARGSYLSGIGQTSSINLRYEEAHVVGGKSDGFRELSYRDKFLLIVIIGAAVIVSLVRLVIAMGAF